MSVAILKRFDDELQAVKGNEEKMDLVLRAKWLYIHRGRNETTFDNPQFEEWRDWIIKWTNNPME